MTSKDLSDVGDVEIPEIKEESSEEKKNEKKFDNKLDANYFDRLFSNPAETKKLAEKSKELGKTSFLIACIASAFLIL